MKQSILIFMLLPPCVAVVQAAEPATVRNPAAHLHGQVLLNIAVEGRDVYVELESPAINLLGFEHSPASAEELALVEKIGSQVLSHASMLEFANGACNQTNVENQFLILGGSGHENEEHAHAHGNEEGHGDIQLHYQLECGLDRNQELMFTGFANFPGISEVVVQWINATGQGRAVLTRDMPSFRME